MTVPLRITPGDLQWMSHTVEPDMPDEYDLYRMSGTSGKWPTTPTYANRKCGLYVIPRIVSGTGTSGSSPAAPTRFELRTRLWDDVRARDRVVVRRLDPLTNAVLATSTHTVQAFRGPHSHSIWQVFDLEDVE